MLDQGKLSTQDLGLKPSGFGNLLLSPFDVDYGTDDGDSTISVKDLEIRLGDRPFARNLRKLYEASGKQIPSDMAVFDKYDVWLLTHSIGAINRRGNKFPEILSLGYQANFVDSEEVYTIELLPRTKFVTNFEITSNVEIALALEGHAQVPEIVTTLLEQIEYLGADASLKLATDQKVVGKLSLKVMSPVIQTVGIGKSQCEWLFEVDQEPLLGDQIMVQTILVPKDTPSVSFKARGYALIKAHWIGFPAMFYTDEIDITCNLT